MRGSLIAYSCGMNKNYRPAAAHHMIANAFEQAAHGNPEYNRVMIFAPPRHGKSMLVSENGPAWYLGNYPNKKIIAASHTAALADDFGAKVRNLLLDPLHQATFGPASGLNPKTTARDDFETIGKGEYSAFGVGASPIGKGANLMIIDDPFKSREEAESPTKRQSVKNWYTASMYTRLEGNASVILMHQRWHEDDLAGWLIDNHAEENWKIINLPAIAETHDELGRVPGEALWWQGFDERALGRIASAIGTRDWLSMYQQRPRSLEGDEFKREYMQYYAKMPQEVARGCVIYILVDAASSKKKNSDNTAMAVVGLGADGNKYLLDGVRKRLSLSERAKHLFDLHRKWQPRYVGYEQYGQMADIEHMAHMMEQENYRFTIESLGGRIKKEERVRRLLPDLENGAWYFPESLMVKDNSNKSVDLIEKLVEDEMLPFPVGAKDDFLDAMSRIYDMKQTYPRASNNRTGVSTSGPRPW